MFARFSTLAAMMTMLSASPASAATAGTDTSPKLSFDIEAVSDYRFRGISLSGGEPALQAEALLEFDSGVWASAWGSTLSGTDTELQLGIGYSKDIFRRLNVELSLSYYAYPSDASSNYFEGAASLSYPLGNLSPRVGAEYAPRQAHLRDERGSKRDNFYAYVAIDWAIRGSPLTLGGLIGYETGLFDTRASGGKWDWQLEASAETKWVNLGLSYFNSNGRLADGEGRNLAGETLVASASKSF